MNKQQLASKIWESANKLRSKIEANEYKDYILGFIFYKYLSDRELKWARENDFSEEDIKRLDESNSETMNYFQENIGYFISYKYLFSTWLNLGRDFEVGMVRDALSAFDRLIYASHKKVFSGIFRTLQTGLSKLGDNSTSQTRAISALLQLIKDIPMDGRQEYDVLGFIYEYLISQFASNAGKKAGEFYTPHEVSLLMSEIVAHHLRGRESIEIYDPTSGSGSLLINIGSAVSRYMHRTDNIKYYAQEVIENTYNLTRMNLVMRGIIPDNIITRNGDTLEDDWPFFDESDPAGTYRTLFVDAVVSNPPYSKHWEVGGKEHDPRFSNFGVAPKSKADYAFLLHDLYHLRQDGIMTIVLPHGVLFRGDAEGDIRRNLLENNHIDTIIGLPANIFFGTGIPTIIMVLRKNRTNNDVLIVDASKGFEKVGKSNQLRASDIRKIADTVLDRLTVPGFSRTVDLEEIRKNNYNLNIPRYIDSNTKAEHWDIHSLMLGGIPEIEIDELSTYWSALPGLRDALFVRNGNYAHLATEDIETVFKNHTSIKDFKQKFTDAFADLSDYLKRELLGRMNELTISQEEPILSSEIFMRLKNITLIDKYDAFQLLHDDWTKIAIDLEMIQTEGIEAANKVEPNMVIKKKDGNKVEVQEGWVGHIMPFELIQKKLLTDDLQQLNALELQLEEITAQLEEIINELPEEDRDILLNDSNDAFNKKTLEDRVKEIFSDISSEEILELKNYTKISKKKEKQLFTSQHPEIHWEKITIGKSGVYNNSDVNKYINDIKVNFKFNEGSIEQLAIRAFNLTEKEKELKERIKVETPALHNKTKATIEKLTQEQICLMLEAKWIEPLIVKFNTLPSLILDELHKKINALSKKYTETLSDTDKKIADTESELVTMLNDLTGSEDDLCGLAELKKLLGGK